MQKQDWVLVCHSDYGDKGSIAVIRQKETGYDVKQIELSESTGESLVRRPVFFGLDANDQAIVMDMINKTVATQNGVPADVFPAYSYRDDEHQRIWFMQDGEKDTGNDTFNCGDSGASVTIATRDADAKLIKTLCVGRGHHVTSFINTGDQKIAFVSNLQDGTICVVNNDDSSDDFLSIKKVINLCEADKEDGNADVVPNNAFPHGMVFSKTTGKLYNLNNGYGTVAVINPQTQEIENRFALKGCSNLLDSPDGRFLIGKGADRKSDAEHVIGKLVVLDAETGDALNELAIQDFYPSVYRFSKDGNKLYVTSASTGKGTQKDNLVNTTVQIYDTSNLPALPLLKTLEVGKAECGRRPIAFAHNGNDITHTFIPNPTDGTMSIFDADDQHVDTVTIAEKNCNELLFSFWGDGIYGA